MNTHTVFIPTIYDVDEIKTIDQTVAGNYEAWCGEVFAGSRNNDAPTENSLVSSPFHRLTVNGQVVPVYTARCGKGGHSFAWIDVINEGDFTLEMSLEMSFVPEKCVVLPQSRGVEPDVTGKIVRATIQNTGSFTFTFGKADAVATDPKLAPLTVMVCREEKLTPPDGYEVVEIQPGYYDDDALEFTESKKVYRFLPGFYDICSIGLPSDSMLYIDRGAYLKMAERKNPDGTWITRGCIHANYVKNVQIVCRGLLDCGKLLGGDDSHRQPFVCGCSEHVSVSGLMVINSPGWSVCAYKSKHYTVERCLLLSYRTFSDGIMMSDCAYGTGRYNFVRTGDDSMEFKGTGWWSGDEPGHDCLFEYNDLWTDKGAGYCLTWESEMPMTNMVFRNNSVGFAQPVWADRNTALDCLLGTNPAITWGKVLFENIEIYHVISPNAINLQIMGKGAKLEDITFRNIAVHSAEEGVYACRMHFSAEGGEFKNILLENVDFCGEKITESHKNDPKLFCNEAPAFFHQLAVKD